MRNFIGLIALGFLILMLGGIMAALDSFRGSDYSEPHIVATAAEETTALIVLANDVLDDNKAVITISSNNMSDAPIAYDYIAVSHQLTVTGLNADDTRTLTIAYKVPRLDGLTDTTARYLPWLLILGGIAMVAGGIVNAVRRD